MMVLLRQLAGFFELASHFLNGLVATWKTVIYPREYA
jgi:hypothetical protein